MFGYNSTRLIANFNIKEHITFKLRCNTHFQHVFTECGCILKMKLRWLTQTKVITFKTQPHVVNALWERVSQRSFRVVMMIYLVEDVCIRICLDLGRTRCRYRWVHPCGRAWHNAHLSECERVLEWEERGRDVHHRPEMRQSLCCKLVKVGTLGNLCNNWLLFGFIDLTPS